MPDSGSSVCSVSEFPRHIRMFGNSRLCNVMKCGLPSDPCLCLSFRPDVRSVNDLQDHVGQDMRANSKHWRPVFLFLRVSCCEEDFCLTDMEFEGS